MPQEILTPDDVRNSAKEDVWASTLHFSAIRIIIHVAHGLPRTKSAQDELLTVAVNNIYEICIRRIQTNPRILRLEKWSCGI